MRIAAALGQTAAEVGPLAALLQRPRIWLSRREQTGLPDKEPLRPTAQPVEQRLVRAGENGLQAKRLNLVEQGYPAPGVQVRGDLVKQQDRRRRNFAARQTRGLGEDQIED